MSSGTVLPQLQRVRGLSVGANYKKLHAVDNRYKAERYFTTRSKQTDSNGQSQKSEARRIDPRVFVLSALSPGKLSACYVTLYKPYVVKTQASALTLRHIPYCAVCLACWLQNQASIHCFHGDICVATSQCINTTLMSLRDSRITVLCIIFLTTTLPVP